MTIVLSAKRARAAAAKNLAGVRRIRLPYVYLIFVAWTLFSVYVYTRYSQLGDSQSYLTGAYEDTAQTRTFVVTWLSSRLMGLGGELFTHLAFSMFAASGVAFTLWHAGLHGIYRWPVLAILLNPNFGVWASVAGRESLFVGLLGMFMGAVLGFSRRPGFLSMTLAVLATAGMVFIRAPYGLGIAVFLLMFLVYTVGLRTRLSLGVQALFLTVLAIGALVVAWPHIDAYITDEVLPKAKSYFTVNSATTRTWIHLQSTGDLFASLWWSLPMALVGPTFSETWARPMLLPFFLSGLVVLGVLVLALLTALFAPRGQVRKILLLGWLPALAIILVTYVPFGVYNPGSAIRYASSFLLFLTFPTLLLSVIAFERAEEAVRAMSSLRKGQPLSSGSAEQLPYREYGGP